MTPKELTAEQERAICEYATELWQLCEGGEHGERSFTTEARLRLYEFATYLRFLWTADVKAESQTEDTF